MKNHCLHVVVLSVVAVIAQGQAQAQTATRVEVQALMNGTAMLRIDQSDRLLKAGTRSPEGVLLISASPREAVIEIGGQRRTLTLSNRIAGNFAAPDQAEVEIHRNANKQYLTSAEINGRRIVVMVDTGANSVAMNSQHARQLGIDYLKIGQPTMVGTASGIAQGYTVVLDKVVIGGIAASFVEATVIEGDFPMQVLLGTTYLQHVGMREENGVMYLRQKY